MVKISDLSTSEVNLLKAISAEEACDLTEQASRHTFHFIRGSLLRSLIMGKLEGYSIPPKGIILRGATVIGDIDLCGCTIQHPIRFENCSIRGVLDFSNSRIEELVLRGTAVERLILSEMTCNGSVILSYGFRTLYPVMARGAKIGGQLGCSGGEFRGYPIAISLEAAIVKESFFWRQVRGLWGVVDLTNAHVGCLLDDPDSWPRKGDLILAGFSYGSIESNTSTYYFDRLNWLERQYNPHLSDDFRPQPFEQLAKVLRESGREIEAVSIAINKLHYQRNANFMRRNRKVTELRHRLRAGRPSIIERILIQKLIEKEQRLNLDNFVLFFIAGWRWLVAFFFWAFAGYGYRPSRCIGWSLLIIVVAGFLYSDYQQRGGITYAPSSLRYDHANSGVPDFHPFAYAADVFIPFVDLGQASIWRIEQDEIKDSQFMLVFNWCYIFLGWIAAAIFGASVTGLIRR